MFKVFMLSLLLLLSQVAFSGTFSSLKISKLVSSSGRTEYSVSKYEPFRIDWGNEILSIRRDHSSESCGPASVNVSSLGAISSLEQFYDEKELAEKLSQLVKQELIVKAIYVYDGDEGDSENCGRATMNFYSEDGEVLQLSFDYNS